MEMASYLRKNLLTLSKYPDPLEQRKSSLSPPTKAAFLCITETLR